jgi:hypothetical protein
MGALHPFSCMAVHNIRREQKRKQIQAIKTETAELMGGHCCSP